MAKLMSTPEVARATGYSSTSIAQMAARGVIPYVTRVGISYRYDLDAVVAALKARKIPDWYEQEKTAAGISKRVSLRYK